MAEIPRQGGEEDEFGLFSGTPWRDEHPAVNNREVFLDVSFRKPVRLGVMDDFKPEEVDRVNKGVLELADFLNYFGKNGIGVIDFISQPAQDAWQELPFYYMLYPRVGYGARYEFSKDMIFPTIMEDVLSAFYSTSKNVIDVRRLGYDSTRICLLKERTVDMLKGSCLTTLKVRKPRGAGWREYQINIQTRKG